MVSTWRTLGLASRGALGAGNAAGRAFNGGLQQAAANRGRRAVRSGMLVPGDASPPPGSGDFYDYRGLMPPKALRGLAGPYAMGGAVDLRSGQRHPVGLYDEILHRHAAVIGPSGSGKTTGVMAPWALAAVEHGHSVVMVDVTGDLVEKLLDAGGGRGSIGARIARWDLTDPDSSISWNWINELDSHEAVTAAAEALVGRERDNDPQPFFGQRDRRVLKGLLATAKEALAAPTPAQLLEAARSQELLRRLAEAAPQHGRRLDEATGADAWEYGRLMSGVVNALEVFEHPGLRQITSHDRLRLSHLFEQPSILVVGAPLHASRDGVAASSLMLALLFRELYKGFGMSRRRVVVLADEAPRLTDRIDFEEVSSVARGAGVSLVVAAQFVEQFADENQRNTILGNCSTYVAMRTASEVSAAYLASRLGERRHTALGHAFQAPTWRTPGGRQWSQSIESSPVLGRREIMDQPWADFPALVHSTQVGAAPFAVDLAHPR